MQTPKKILITGACGYIGAVLVRHLSRTMDGIIIRLFDNLSSGNFNALVDLPLEGHFQFIEADVLNPTQLEFALQDIDTVIHLAAIVKTPLSYNNPSWLDQVNNWGTAHLLDACIENGVKNLIFPSSTSVYGPGTKKAENNECNPLGPYANSKLSAENYIRKRSKDINFTILRFGTVYGASPVLRVESFINRLAFLAGTKKKVSIFGDGEQTRPAIHIDDCCSLIQAVLKNSDRFTNEVYNAVEGNYSVNKVVKSLKEARKDVKTYYTNQDIRTHYSFGVTTEKLKKTGWEPKMDISSGIKKLLGSFKGFERMRLKTIDDLI